MRILIADDDPVARRLLEGTLVRHGHEVVAVSNGTDALARLRQPDGPKLAILDWMMPGADGLTVCRMLRQEPGPYVYLIVLTARDRREDRETGLDAEADDFLTKPFDLVELRARLRCGGRVIALQEKLLKAHEDLRHEASHDQLTGLWNRGTILDTLDRELHRAKREHMPLTVAMADLDHFKQVNDTHGHATGDVVLREAAQRMQSVLRKYDQLGRYGGEEFLVLLTGSTVPAARPIIQRALDVVSGRPVEAAGVSLCVTLSAGIAGVGANSEPESLLAQADEALYRAKAAGRNRLIG
ncbi:MAG: GGDEF domain-containing protein [Vicinamibacterales bacterium]